MSGRDGATGRSGGGGGLSPEARALLREVRAPRAMSGPERARTRARVARLAVAPAAGSLAWMWAKGVAVAAGVGLAGAVVMGTVVLPAVLGVPQAPRAASAPARAPRAARARAVSPTRPPSAPAAPGAASEAGAASAPSGVADAPPRAAVASAPARLARSEPGASRGTNVAVAAEPVPVGEPAQPSESATPLGDGRATSASGGDATTSAVRESALVREVALLRRASAVLARDPSAALALAEEHAREFPRGEMLDERELVAVDALMRLGRRDEARARGAALLAHAPGSTAAARARAVLDAGR